MDTVTMASIRYMYCTTTDNGSEPSRASTISSNNQAIRRRGTVVVDPVAITSTHVTIEPDPPEPAHMHLTRYPPIPLTAFTGNRYYIFGWKLSLKEVNKRAEKIPLSEISTSWPNPSTYLTYLANKSGYQKIHLFMGFPEDVEVPDDLSKVDECGGFTAIGITPTRSLRLFWQRPSQVQFERLKKLIGEDNPPMWIKDSMPKETFEGYEF